MPFVGKKVRDPEQPPKKRAHTFKPEHWWPAAVAEKVQTGRGKQAAGSELMTQATLSTKLEAAYKDEGKYHPSEISRCVLGQVVPIRMAEQISTLLDIPWPVFIAKTKDEAIRMAQQRVVTVEPLRAQQGRTRDAAAALAREEDAISAEIALMKPTPPLPELGASPSHGTCQTQVVRKIRGGKTAKRVRARRVATGRRSTP